MRATALRAYRELLQAAWVREVPVGPVDEDFFIFSEETDWCFRFARVARILRDEKVAFAIVGGFAVIEYGYERFTKDVDVLVYAADLQRAMAALRAAGMTGNRTPIGAKMRDPATGVDVNLLGTAFDAEERALARSVQARTALPVISVASRDAPPLTATAARPRRPRLRRSGSAGPPRRRAAWSALPRAS